MVECNLCGWRAESFRDYNDGYGHIYPQAECGDCRAHPRHRSLAFLLDPLLKDKGLRVLHVAPERFFNPIWERNPQLDYVSIDASPGRAMAVEELCHLTFPSDDFDLVICLHVLEHIENDAQALRELFRVTKPGGLAVLDVPMDDSRATTYEDPSIVTPEERSLHFWQFDHVRLYGRDFGDRVSQAGFAVAREGLTCHEPTGVYHGLLHRQFHCARKPTS